MVDEGLLQGMQRAVRRQTLDGGHLRAVLHDGERQAGVDAPAVDQHGAGAALAVIAALFGAGQVEMVAQSVKERRPRRHRELPFDAVDDEFDGNFIGRRNGLTNPARRACWRHMHLHTFCGSTRHFAYNPAAPRKKQP